MTTNLKTLSCNLNDRFEISKQCNEMVKKKSQKYEAALIDVKSPGPRISLSCFTQYALGGMERM